MTLIESVVIPAEDGQIPPEHVLTITGHPAGGHLPHDELSITISGHTENAAGHTETTIAYFNVAADDLYAALDLVLGNAPARQHPALEPVP